MATPAKSVQARDSETVMEMYTNLDIPAFGIRQGGSLPFKYTGDSIEEGTQKLQWILEKLTESESAAIYTLVLYEHPEKGVNEGTKGDISINFRLIDHTTSYLPAEQYRGSYGALMGEIKELRKTVEQIQKEKQVEPASSLGMIGEIMEMEAVQPIMMAIGNRIADVIMGQESKPMGTLSRVSGIPGLEPDSTPVTSGWKDNPMVIDALDRMSLRVPDLPELLKKLADMAEQKPGQFGVYAMMIRKIKIR